MSFGKRKIHVPMPQSELYRKTVDRDKIIEQYGESTVLRAEISVILNIMLISGMIRGNEFIDAMMMQCERIEQERRLAANLDEDRG